ncbi:MAG TPA: hypothetical protein VJP77_04185 [Planctomycetota bacterium]|nr:hypothetical protein [Planctomycetota bacterium]
MADLQLQFPFARVPELAARYGPEHDHKVEEGVAPAVREQGYFTREQFLMICRWKSPRTRKHVEANEDADVRELTRLALSTTSERGRIQIPTLLRGVDWPTASVLLHFGHGDP